MPLEDTLIYTVIVLGALIACSIVIYAMRKRGKKEEKIGEEEKLKAEFGLPFKITKSVSPDEASRAKEELRILSLEREILSDAIRRLYEAHAEGKITEEERERLAETYKNRMVTVKEAISKDEHLVALHELEAMQEDLLKLFSERFDELSGKIEELRSKVEAKPIKEIAIPTPKAEAAPKLEEKPEGEEKVKRKRKPAAKPSPKTEAEKRIEEIRAEVEKVLERLGQMEIET
ncbi:MAG: hypothetical protein QHH17_05125 [Candidatus Bathyarchaeota archaeon]|nr:hypothetical protein [Candidatus Bathyarchaeota archaeon]